MWKSLQALAQIIDVVLVILSVMLAYWWYHNAQYERATFCMVAAIFWGRGQYAELRK